MQQPHARALFVLPLVAAFALSACVSEVDPASDVGDTGEVSAAASTSACKLSKSSILAKAVGARKSAIARGFTWYEARVPYSQSRSRTDPNGTYRTDCSGFISMCWRLGTSYTTASFMSGAAESSPIGSYENLLPGDALVRRSGGKGHIVLFLGWNDAAHASACVLEQASTAQDMQFRARSKSSLTSGGFKAIRADALASTGASSAPTDDESDADEGPTGDTDDGTEPAGGQACTSTGACNPGNEGAGLVCVDGRCTPGCNTSAQCPGATTCASGQCR
jgi:hypothetical protein